MSAADVCQWTDPMSRRGERNILKQDKIRVISSSEANSGILGAEVDDEVQSCLAWWREACRSCRDGGLETAGVGFVALFLFRLSIIVAFPPLIGPIADPGYTSTGDE